MDSKIYNYQRKNKNNKTLKLDRLYVASEKVITVWIPSYEDNNKKNIWYWKNFKRQIDVVVGLKCIDEKEEKTNIPLIVAELKSGIFNSDELDKKSAIYGPLREIYLWVYAIFIHKDISKRDIGDDFLFRNARHFNTILCKTVGSGLHIAQSLESSSMP